MRQSIVVLAGLLVFAASASGQPPARWQAGGSANIGQPVGDFKQNVQNAAGLQAHALLRLDDEGRTSLRIQGGWLNYGHESQRSCVGTAPHCRVDVRLSTANGIVSLGLGPQFTVALGRVRAYGYGLVGMSRFSTVSGLDAGLLPDIVAADENYGDGGLLLSGGLGLQLPVTSRTQLDIGFGYEHHGKRDYLIEGGLTDEPDGSLGFDIKRSTASLYAIRIGFTTIVGRKAREAAAAQ